MNNTDNLFKKKLEEANVAPRPEAWEKVQMQLTKKNNGLPWFRMAAAFLLLGLLTATWFYLQTREVPQQITIRKNKVNPDSGKVPSPQERITEKPGVQKKVMKKVEPKVKPTIEKVNPSLVEVIPDQLIATKQEKIEIKTDTVNSVTVAAATIARPIVIEYVLLPIPDSKPSTEAMPLASKKTGLQRALEFAQEAKNSDNPLSGLRQAKNELFALSFKKDKQKKQ